MNLTKLAAPVASGLLLAAASLAAQPRAPEPTFRFPAESTVLSLRAGGSATFKVDVALPLETHIYVSHINALSFNILTQFSTTERGWGLETNSRPEGVAKDEDMILPGKGAAVAGTYELELFETQGRAPGPRVYVLPITIKTQMCNSRTNICYRPQEFKRNVRVRISGAREIVNRRAVDGPVKWVEGYDQAFSKARATGQNVFALLTAPEWCGYCIRLERDVMTKDGVAQVLNAKFIPLRVTDNSPDKGRFNFDGYPTMLVLAPNGQVITEINSRQEQTFLNEMQRYAIDPAGGGGETDPVAGAETFNYTVQLSGKFTRANGRWTGAVDGQAQPDNYTEVRRDQNFVVLKNDRTQEFVALPLRGGDGFIYRDNRWVKYFRVSR